MGRLLTACQEELLSLDELRARIAAITLTRKSHAGRELQAITNQTADRAVYLQLAETLTAFPERLQSNADVVDCIGAFMVEMTRQ